MLWQVRAGCRRSATVIINARFVGAIRRNPFLLGLVKKVQSTLKCTNYRNSVRHRIDFKIATITFKVLQFQQPSYLASLILRYVPTRSLRSSSSLSIFVPSRKTTMAKSKSFSSVASYLWNKLPCHLSSISTLPAFRKRLKHHLFSSAFPGNPSPSNDIMFYDVSPSTNATQVRHTPPPS